jgi:hypothetical protein
LVPESPSPQSRPLASLPTLLSDEGSLRILDFDLECLAAGYADPNWVPQKITCAAWSWIGSDEVRSVITGKDGFFDHRLRVERLEPLFAAIAEADILTGHNIVRYDLPVLNAELMRSAGRPLEPIRVQDTIRLPKTKGLKKGLDNLSRMLGVRATKMPLNWVEWDAAYEQDGWPEVVARCESDVVLHKQERQAAIDAGWNKPTVLWKP